jgi:hypothetical protein
VTISLWKYLLRHWTSQCSNSSSKLRVTMKGKHVRLSYLKLHCNSKVPPPPDAHIKMVTCSLRVITTGGVGSFHARRQIPLPAEWLRKSNMKKKKKKTIDHYRCRTRILFSATTLVDLCLARCQDILVGRDIADAKYFERNASSHHFFVLYDCVFTTTLVSLRFSIKRNNG